MKTQRPMAALLFLGLVSSGEAATIPSGTPLEIRLTSEASSSKPSGEPISGVITAPVFLNGAIALGSGTKVTGKTADANAGQLADGQTTEEKPATLRLVFTRLEDSSGHAQDISAVLGGVDNARESVDKTGLITGIHESQTYEARIDQGIGKIPEKYQALAQMLTQAKSGFVKKVDTEIDYKPGVDLTLSLTKPLDWTGPAATNTIGAIQPVAALQAMVNAEPSRTVAQNPPKPSDLTNLMFIGTEQQIRAAFEAAGWSLAAALSANSKMETARAMIENRGYSEAPVSVLYLDGKPPDMAFQKQNDTFDMRHHIRLWRRPDLFNGKPVWVAAGTHDTGIVFSKTSHNFTHGIDPNIDLERSKVTNDILFSGQIHGEALVPRPGIPADLSNATGDQLKTDRSMTVLEFN